MAVRLPDQRVVLQDGTAISFDIDPLPKEMLMRGMDAVAMTLEHAAAIRAFELRYRDAAPWYG
jgi:3-isopropylmalate/(R)-2-methylmalate dehydratase small subunit